MSLEKECIAGSSQVLASLSYCAGTSVWKYRPRRVGSGAGEALDMEPVSAGCMVALWGVDPIPRDTNSQPRHWAKSGLPFP